MKCLRIKEAVYAGDLKVMLTFNDGVVTLVDFGMWIKQNPHTQYNRYLDEKKFKKFYLDARTELLTYCMMGVSCE